MGNKSQREWALFTLSLRKSILTTNEYNYNILVKQIELLDKLEVKTELQNLADGYKVQIDKTKSEITELEASLCLVNTGDVVKFIDDDKAYTVICSDERFAIATRKLCRIADNALLHFEVERGAYLSFMSAYNALKTEPVYTILDKVKGIRGAHNLIFNGTDFNDLESVKELLDDLNSGDVEISSRNYCTTKIERIS